MRRCHLFSAVHLHTRIHSIFHLKIIIKKKTEFDAIILQYLVDIVVVKLVGV